MTQALGSVEGYQSQLDAMRVLAQRDLLAWWKKTEGLGFMEQRAVLADPFAAIVATYGEQAAYVAADYVFLSRSWDDELKQLPYPEVADPVGFEQAKASYRYAMWLQEYTEDPQARQVALRRLQGITNRLVMVPAHHTVVAAVAKAGTRYARVPEPGACPFCLMLASRGAVYAVDTVVGELGEFHDNCRCLGIEVKTDADLPQINKDLRAQWERLDKEIDGKPDLVSWRRMIVAQRQQAGQSVVWPRLQYATVPTYRGDGTSRVFVGEPLPDLSKMPGHVLYGWRDVPTKDGRGVPHTEDMRDGHRWDSQRPGASTFPQSWSDQKIVDAVRDTIENPDWFLVPRGQNGRREVWKIIDGISIKAEYTVINGQAKTDTVTAYPDDSKKRKRTRSED